MTVANTLDMQRRAENIGVAVTSARLEGGDVTPAFMHDAKDYVRGVIDSAELLARTRRRYGLE